MQADETCHFPARAAGTRRVIANIQIAIVDIRAEVQRVKAETTGYRHMVGGSDDILYGTPFAHMQALLTVS